MRNSSSARSVFVAFTITFAIFAVAACSSDVVSSSGELVCQPGTTCSCTGAGTCVARCAGSGCNFQCAGGGSCEFSCPQGGCTVSAQGGGPATLDCGGKTNCSMDCQGGGACNLKACANQCKQECLGGGDCTMSGCSGTCSQSCVGGGKCSGAEPRVATGTASDAAVPDALAFPGFDAGAFDAGDFGGEDDEF